MNSRLYSTVVVSKAPNLNQQNNSHEGLDQELRKITDSIFLRLCAQELTQDEMKIEFAKQILTLVLSNSQNRAQINGSWQYDSEYFNQIDELMAENMSFLKTVFPQMKGFKGKNNFIQHFKDWDQSDKVQFDFLVNMGIHFQGTKNNNFQGEIKHNKSAKPERAYILQQTQTLFNKIIIAAQEAVPKFNHILRSVIVNELPRKMRSQYEETLKDPRKFQVDILLANQTKLFNKQLIHENLTIDSFGLFEVIKQWTNDLSNMLNNSEKYLQDKQYLKINSGSSRIKQLSKVKSMKIFGRKSNVSRSTLDDTNIWDINLFGELPQNQDPQTKGQKKQKESLWQYVIGGFRQLCKNKNDLQGFDGIDEKSKNKYVDKRSAALWGENKHIRKKVDAIEGEIKKIDQNQRKYQNYKFRQSGYPIASYIQAFNEIGNSNNLEGFIAEQIANLRNCYSQNLKIVQKNMLKQKYTQNQKKIYSFSQNTYDFVQEILLEKLVFLMTAILEYQEFQKIQKENKSVVEDIQLFSMRLREMMSASLVGDQSFITSVYKCMIELHSARQISIMKVKNRLSTCNKDILICFTISGSPITCSLKLILEYKEAAVQSKQVASQMMHNFFSEIQNSSYGPLSYLSHILASMDHRIKYLSQIKKVQADKNVPLSHLCHCRKGIISEESPYFLFESQIKKIINEDNQIDLNVYRNMLQNSFVCGICEKAIKKGMNVLPVQKCFECNFTICVDCAYQVYPQQQLKAYLALLDSIARINDPSCQANLILQDLRKMQNSHSYRKQIQKVNFSQIQKKIQHHYDIIIQGRNIVKYDKKDTVEGFWRRVREKIELKKLPSYENIIKKEVYAGVILRPRQLLRKKGTPFVFIHFNGQNKKFSKFSLRNGNYTTNLVQINQLELQLEQNDIFFPILWLQGEQLIPEYICKVLDTNPFCKKSKKKQSPIFEKVQQISSRSDAYDRQKLFSENSSLGDSNMMRRSNKKTKISRPRYSANRLVR